MRTIIYLTLILGSSLATAQEHPQASLKHLNTSIAEQSTPELLFQRAVVHKTLGNTNLAAADLHAATQAKPNMLAWQLERSRVELLANRPSKALVIASQSLNLAKNNTQRAQIHIIRAEAYLATQKYKPSLHACQLAFREIPKGEPQWYTLRSESQRKLGQFEPRINGLRAGLKHYPSASLRAHLADALIDAGQHSEALTIINNELPTLRWQSSWLIKRARIHQATQRHTAAESDLQTAMQEIDSRLSPTQPDPHLLREKAKIFLLKNDTISAEATIKLMQRHNAPHSLVKEVSTQLPGK